MGVTTIVAARAASTHTLPDKAISWGPWSVTFCRRRKSACRAAWSNLPSTLFWWRRLAARRDLAWPSSLQTSPQ